MRADSRIADLFEGAAAKYLSAVDAESTKSNQHEIGGLPSVGFKTYLGTPGKGDGQEISWPATMVYITDEDSEPVRCESQITWYDSRRLNVERSAEYRLYYPDNPVTELLAAGHLFLIAKRHDQSLLMIFTPSDTQVESQLRHLFGLGTVGEIFQPGLFDESPLVLPLRFLLEDLGVGAAVEADDDELLRVLQARFPGGFPRTAEFSGFARERTPDCNHTDADIVLMSWMETEERMFRVYERHLVRTRLADGFGAQGDQVDDFISFSLSVQNRRKSRVGHAFENHLGELFDTHGLQFERGSGRRMTENNAKPDFLFPTFGAYHDANFPLEELRLLGAKTTCKDRWRQVLSEGARVRHKHLVTLEPGISDSQIDEMRANDLQLVVPLSIQSTYGESQRQWLQSVDEFIGAIKAIQA